MKKIIFILLLLIAAIACEPVFCWECHEYSNEDLYTIVDTITICDETEANIQIIVNQQAELGKIFGCNNILI